jgi:hypothetical protein
VIAMMIYDMTLQHQAGRRMSTAEQRRADEQIGMMAAWASRLWRQATRPVRARRGVRAARTPAQAR